MELDILERYIKWIKDNTLSDEIKKGVWKISTPFLDRHNDHLDIYAIAKDHNTFTLTDDGYILEDLKISGFELNTPKRKEIFEVNAKRLSVEFNEKTHELFIETSIEELGRSKHNLIQAMLTINDMFCLAQPTVTTIFKEDIKEYFIKKSIRFIEDIRITGRSGYEHSVDFAIAADNKRPERIIKSINMLSKQQIKNLIFMFIDIEENRKNIKKIVIFNDEFTYSKTSLNALEKYSVLAVPWSKKEEYIEQFVST